MMMLKNLALLVALSMCGCAAHAEDAPQPVRLRFVPVDTHKECGGGANFTRLSPAPGRPGALFAIVHAGLKDEFPIQDQRGKLLFSVAVPEATDERFLLEIRTDRESQKITLRRDKAVTVQIAEGRYEFYFPTCHVNPSAKATTNKALLIVTRLPQSRVQRGKATALPSDREQNKSDARDRRSAGP
jgi:hypothetical protein